MLPSRVAQALVGTVPRLSLSAHGVFEEQRLCIFSFEVLAIARIATATNSTAAAAASVVARFLSLLLNFLAPTTPFPCGSTKFSLAL